VHAQEGYYQTITNVASGLVLEVDGNLSGSNVQVGNDTGAFNQRWHVFSVATGEYFIRTVQPGYRAADCYNWGTANGTNIIIWDYAGGANQIFQIVPVGTTGYYKIVTKQDLNQCLDAAGTTDGSNVRLWTYTGAANQLWTLSGDGRGESTTLQPGQDIQAAIEAYRTVNLAEGTWTINSGMSLHGGLTLNGSGMYQTILKGPNTEYSYAFFGNPYVGPLTDVTIKNLKCDGNANVVYGNHCINPQDPIRMHVENVYIVDFKGMGVSTGGSVNCYYDNVVCDGCGQMDWDPSWHNWYSRRITGDTIVNSVCRNSPHGNGMKLSVHTGVTVDNCTFYGNAYDGMCTQDTNSQFTITNCTAFNNGWFDGVMKGFYLYSNDGSLMENCLAFGNCGNGIYVISDASTAPNYIRNCTAYANHPTWNAIEPHWDWVWDGKLSSPPDTIRPAAPMGLSVTTGNGAVALDWEDNPEPDLATYSVYRSAMSDSGYIRIASGLLSSTYTDHTATNGIKYYYVMTATDTYSNESTESGWISATPGAGGDLTPPAAPVGLTATAGDGSVLLGWTANTEPDLAGYTIYRSTSTGGPFSVIVCGLTDVAYTDVAVDDGTTYYYMVTAADTSVNESAASAEVSATPQTNRGPVAWWDFEDGVAGADIPGTTHWTIYRIGVPDATGNGNHLCDYWDIGESSSIAYSSNVPAVSGMTNTLSGFSEGNSPSMFTWSDQSAPAGVDLETAVLDKWTIEAFVNASVIAGSNRGIVGRDGRRSSTDVSSPLYFNIQGSGKLRCTYYDQAANIHDALSAVFLTTNNWYYVAATCDGMYLKLWLADLTAGQTQATEVASIGVWQSADPDFGPWPDGTRGNWSVFRQYYNGGDVDRFMGNIDEVRISNAALNINTQGLLSLSGVPDTTPPSAPTGLVATAGDSSVALDWADNTEGDLAGYNVYRSTTSGSYGAALITGLTASSYTDNTVTNGTTYYYVVTAVDTSSNESAYSSEVSALPQAPQPATLLDDGFELSFDQWTDGGTTDWDRTTAYKYAGSYSAHAGSSDNDLISDNLNTAGYTTITIDFWFRDDDIDDSDNIYLQLYNGSGYANNLELGNSAEDTWQHAVVTITNSGTDTQYFRSNFRIKFEGTSIDSGENLWIDAVKVTVQ
jgi:parallel beta-helix repeat protein